MLCCDIDGTEPSIITSPAGKEGLENVLDASRKVCLSRYEKPAFYPRGYQRQVKEFFIASKGVVKSQDGTITIEEISTMQVIEERFGTCRYRIMLTRLQTAYIHIRIAC